MTCVERLVKQDHWGRVVEEEGRTLDGRKEKENFHSSVMCINYE